MPFTDGVFSRVHDWTTDRDNQIKIDADRMDAEDDGFAAAINAILDGTQGALDGAVGAPTVRFHGDDDSGLYLESDGVIGLSIAGTKEIEFKAGVVNIITELQVGGTTLDVNSLGTGTRTADGAITAAKVIARQSDGTAKQVAETGTAQSVGTEDAIVAADRDYSAVCYDRLNNKSVAFLADTAPTYGAIKYSIGTQTGEDMVWTTEASAYGSGSGTGGFLRAADDGAGNLLCLMRHKTALRPQAILFSSDGSTLTQDDIETINAATSSGGQSLCWDEDNSTWVCGFGKGASGVSGGYVVCVSASGGASTLHTEVQFEAGAVDEQDMARDNTNDKILLVYIDGGNSDRLTACVLTVSGYVITANTPVVLVSSPCSEPVVEHDAASGNFVVGYRDSGGDLYAMMVDVTGTVPSPNTAVQIGSGDYLQIEQGGGGFVAVWNDSANSNYVSARPLTPIGTTIDVGTASVIVSAVKTNISCVENEDLNNSVFVYTDGTAAVDSIVVTPAQTSTNAASWIGIAKTTVADTETVSFFGQGDIASGLSGLVFETNYYVDSDGDLTTSVTPYGKIGYALSATELMITENNAP